MQRIKIIIVFMLLFAGFACRDPYKPDLISSSNAYLVIEGVLNAGNGPTTIRLSRTFKLDDTAKVKGEQNAMVIVEGKDNTSRQLIMDGEGIYTSPGLNLVLKNEYRLRIITANGKEYLSDYVVAKNTPPIDSLGFKQDDKGVEIHVSTHDDSGDTRYYRWDYDETWEIRTYYISEYKYLNGSVVPRFPDYVSNCWKYNISSKIILGSSAHLQSDNIFRAPVAFFANGDEKLAVRYSILLHQYALDKQGYEFYEMMKKNTESLGTIFDAQPSEIKGNIHCVTDPGELVIGYVSAAVVEQKRFFISEAELQQWKFYQDCPSVQVRNHPDSISTAINIGFSFYSSIPPGPFITHYLASLPVCVDCTERGGSLIRPSYW